MSSPGEETEFIDPALDVITGRTTSLEDLCDKYLPKHIRNNETVSSMLDRFCALDPSIRESEWCRVARMYTSLYEYASYQYVRSALYSTSRTNLDSP